MVIGKIDLRRAYYWCNNCHRGYYPKDQAMGLDSSCVSPGVVRMIGLSAALERFAQSQVLLRELAAVKVSVKQVERAAERFGGADQ